LYRLIDEESDRQPVSRLCRTLGVTRSGYYDWQRQPLSDRALANWRLTEQIRGIFDESEQTYGSPRIFKELKLGRGIQVGEKRVARLMSQAGLRSIHAKKRKGSTTRAKEHPLAPDLVGRDFAVDGPDRLWVADFTQLTTWQGTCYIAVVADAYSRLCLGWAVRTEKTVDLVLEALDMAIWRRGQMQAAGAIHHSDQGSQGGFNWSSQRLDEEELRWAQCGDERRIVRGGLGCGRQGGRRWRGGSTASGSGRRSLEASRARTRPPRRACRRRSASGGSARVAACRRSACGRRRVATCRSVSGKRSRCCAPAVRASARSRGSFGVRRRRSRASCVGMPRPAAAGSSTAPRRRSGTRIGARDDRSRPSSRRMRSYGGMCRSGSRGR
jgi:putative transposase